MQHKYFALGIKLSWGPWRDLVTQASGGLEYGMAEGSLVGLRGFGPSNHEGEDEKLEPYQYHHHHHHHQYHLP